MSIKKDHIILLGGLGGDSHSVGLSILRQAITSQGYKVLFLGTQNREEEFFEYAEDCSVVMMSCLDGHAQRYLMKFPKIRSQCNYKSLWYIGGNLSVEKNLEVVKHYRSLGFDRVFPSFIDIRSVLEVLEKDLYNRKTSNSRKISDRFVQLKNRLLSCNSKEAAPLEECTSQTRSKVLESYHTGLSAINMEENALFLKSSPSFARIQSLVNESRLPMIIQPRSGVATVKEQIKYFEAFKQYGINALSYQVDSLTRQNNYQLVEEVIRNGIGSSNSLLNGFPIVNHGVKSLRQIAKSIKTPLQTRHSTYDPRLLAEISYAGGITSFEGGAICYNIPYYNDYPLELSLSNWEYIDRLTGEYYHRFGIVLDREFFGVLTGTLIPPSLAIVTGVLEALLAVKQGVKSISIGWAEQGNRVQDIAAIRVIKELVPSILNHFGFKGIQINSVFHQYMAAFPESLKLAEKLIQNSATTGLMSGATRLLSKTPVEAVKIPSLAENLMGLSLIRQGLLAAKNTHVDPGLIDQESRIIRAETLSIIQSILHCGRGSVEKGIIEGFKKGWLDIPFSPSRYNAGAVQTIRDMEGAIRYLNTGNLQLEIPLVNFNLEKCQERISAGEKRLNLEYEVIEDDVLQIVRGRYDAWPLFTGLVNKQDPVYEDLKIDQLV